MIGAYFRQRVFVFKKQNFNIYFKKGTITETVNVTKGHNSRDKEHCFRNA